MTITSLRGKDSTGVAVVGGGKPRVIKAVGAPDYLLSLDAWTKVQEFSIKKGKAMFGHGRFATLGNIVAKNAHPHTVDHITLVHNGTISFGLDEDMKVMETDNDSLGLCHAIAKRGLVEALSNVIGAYAIIGYDSQLEKIFVVTNGERPLHQVMFAGNRIIMSEERACEFLAIRNSYGSFKPHITYFPKHSIYWIDPKTEEVTIDKSLEEAVRKKYHPPVPKFGTFGGGNTSSSPKVETSTQYLKDPIKLMCSHIEPMKGSGNMYRYLFISEDDAMEDIIAMSSVYQPERVGAFASAKEIGIIKQGKGVPEYKFVKFRELEWEQTAKEPVKEEEDQPGKLVRFQNGHQLSQEDARRVLQREDCALCQGPINENEIADTIITTNKTLICKDCIVQGRHFAFGFGQ